jgi:hypothetical protein
VAGTLTLQSPPPYQRSGYDNSRLRLGWDADRAVDLLAAHEDGIEAVGVLWGYGFEAELAEVLPICLLKRVDELVKVPDLCSD